jgi:hypothetical protein
MAPNNIYFTRFGDTHGTKAYKLIGLGETMALNIYRVTSMAPERLNLDGSVTSIAPKRINLYGLVTSMASTHLNYIGFGDIHGLINSQALNIRGPKACKLYWLW